jgi:hypothetical protein
MIPMEEEPPQIHREYVEILRQKGVAAAVSVVED